MNSSSTGYCYVDYPILAINLSIISYVHNFKVYLSYPLTTVQENAGFEYLLTKYLFIVPTKYILIFTIKFLVIQ